MKAKNMKLNYIYNMLYEVFLLIIPLVVTPYVSKTLLEDGVGQYSFSFSIVSYFVLLANWGFSMYSQREIANCQENTDKQKNIFWEIFIARSVFVVFSLVIYLILLCKGIYPAKYTVLIGIMTVNIVSVMFDIAFLFKGNDEFGKLVVRNIVIKSLGIVSIFLFVKDSRDVWVYALIQSLSLLLSNFSLWFFVPKKFYTSFSVKVGVIMKRISSSSILFLPAMAGALYVAIGKTLIGLITSSDSQVGMYEQADQLVRMGLVFLTSLGTIMITRNSDEISKGNVEQFKSNIELSVKFSMFIGLPLMFGVAAVSNNFSPWYFGESYILVPMLLKVLSPLIVIVGLSNVLGTTCLIPLGKDKAYVSSVLIGACVNSLLSVLFVYVWECMGAALASIVSNIVQLLLMIYFLKDDVNIFKMIKHNYRYFIAGIVMFLICYYADCMLFPSFVNTSFIVIVGCFSYFLLLLMLRDTFFIKIVKNIFRVNSNK